VLTTLTQLPVHSFSSGRMNDGHLIASHSAPARMSLTHIARTFREHLLSGFSWNVVAALTLQGSVLLSSVIVARLIGLASFGAYAILVSTVMTIAAVAQGGSGLVATKYVGEFLASDPQRVARVLHLCRVFTLATSTLAAAVVIGFAHVLSADLLRRPELTTLVRLAAIAIFFQVSVSYQYGALQGFGAFRELGYSSALAGFTYIVFTIGGARIGSLEGALIGFVLASVFRSALFGVFLRRVRRERQIPAHTLFHRAEFRMMWRFALPASLAGFVTMTCLWLATVLVARQPDGLAQVAILSAAHQLRLAALQLPSLLNTVSFSVMSRLKGQNESIGFRTVFWSSLWINFAFAALIVAMLVIGAEPLLKIYGSDFSAGQWVLVVLLISVLPEILATSAYQLVQSSGQMWRSLLIVVLPRDFTYLALAALLLPFYGAIGVAMAYAIAWFIALALITLLIRATRISSLLLN